MARTIWTSPAPAMSLEGKTFWKGWEGRVRTAAKTLEKEVSKKHEGILIDFNKFTPKDYLLSWATIVGGVEPESNGYYIIPQHGKWVNDNGNAWLNQVLLESYKSFIWAENYVEHIQIPELSKGKILDAVAWVLMEHIPGKKEEVPSIFIDILVATNKKKHPVLVEKILTGKMRYLSMGCNITFSQCSKCGKIFEEGEDEPCSHIQEKLGQYFKDKNGYCIKKWNKGVAI